MGDGRDVEADGGREVGIDERMLYDVVWTAVEDAILDVLGTVALLVIALVVVWVGGTVAVSAGSTDGLAGGIAAVGAGVALAAIALDLVRSSGSTSDRPYARLWTSRPGNLAVRPGRDLRNI